MKSRSFSMSPLQTITEANIRAACGETIFERAFQYACSDYIRKRIVSPKIWQVRAEFEGNYGTYKAGFQPLEGGFIKTWCTCPAEMSFCKHAAALGITYIREPDTFFDIDSINEMLNRKSKKELQQLLEQVFDDNPKYLSLLGIEGFEEDDDDEWDEE